MAATDENPMARAAAIAVFRPDHTGGASAGAEAAVTSAAEAAAGGTAVGVTGPEAWPRDAAGTVGMVVVRAHGIGAVSSEPWAEAVGVEAVGVEALGVEAGSSGAPEGWSGWVMVAPREFGLWRHPRD